MASSSLASKLFANVLKGFEREKAEELRKEWESRKALIDAEEARQRADAALLAKRKADLSEREQRERDELTALERKAREVLSRSEEERRIDAAGARAAVFRGSSGEDVRERLRREGVPEGLAQDITRLRTLDQELENSGGMRARMLERSGPTGQGAEPLYRSVDENSNGTLGRRDDERQYLRAEEPSDAYSGAGLARPPGANESDQDKEDGVRKGLGLGNNNLYR